MNKITKRILCMIFIFTFLLSAMATTTFAAIYSDEDYEIIWSNNQFLNPGFEYDTSSSDNVYWRAVSVYRNIEGATANPGSSSGFTLPFDTQVKNSGNRSLKIVETNSDSYIDIMRIKDYYSTGANIRDGAYKDGFKKFNISAYYKNIDNVKGVQLRVWYESKATWGAVFIHDSEVVDLDGDNWTKVSWDIDLDTITATEGANEGEVLDPAALGEGNIRLRFTPVAQDESVICKYNIDDIDIKYLKSEGYKYINLVNENDTTCEVLDGFTTNQNDDCPVTKTIDTEIKHSGEGSLKAVPTGNYQVLAGFKPIKQLEEGATYYLSAWIYSDSAAARNIKIRYAHKDMAGFSGKWLPGNDASTTVFSTKPGEWKRLEVTFVPNAELCSSELKYIFFTNDTGADTFYFDDITLRKYYDGNTALGAYYPLDDEENVKLNNDISFEFTKEIETNDIEIEYYINGEKQPNDAFILEKDVYVLNIKQDGGLVSDSDYKIVIKKLNDVWGKKVLENKELKFSTASKVGFDVKLYDENGKIDSPKAGDITAKIDLKNNSGAPLNARCVIMVCENERVKKVFATDNISLATDETKPTIELEIEDVPNNNCYLKAFLWTEATKDLRALAQNIEFR